MEAVFGRQTVSIDDMLATLELAGFSFIKAVNYDIWYARKPKDDMYWSSRVSLLDCIEGAWRKYVNDEI
jgi:hypothetical protein